MTGFRRVSGAAERDDTRTAGAQIIGKITGLVGPATASGAANVGARQVGAVQLRVVEYAPGYLADHWCSKGHVIYVIAGELTIEHRTEQRACELATGMSWHVGDDQVPAHRVRSERGATVFILD